MSEKAEWKECKYIDFYQSHFVPLVLTVSEKNSPGVNFINIIHMNFLYAHHFSSYVLALLKNSYEKCTHIMLMKLTTGTGKKCMNGVKI